MRLRFLAKNTLCADVFGTRLRDVLDLPVTIEVLVDVPDTTSDDVASLAMNNATLSELRAIAERHGMTEVDHD